MSDRSGLHRFTDRFSYAGALIVALALLASACGRESSSAERLFAADAGSVAAEQVSAGDYDRSLFAEDSAVVDNPWFPLVPGTRYVWKGTALDEGEQIERKVVFVVTDLTKVIDGVTTVVGWDRDYDDRSLRESELVFFAQDVDGNVWHLGELVELWEERRVFEGAHTWFVESPAGARAGIQMLARPMVGARYSQGFAPPPLFWDDRARVSAVDVRTCVPVGCFDGSIITEEFEPRFRGAVQLKYYAPGIGNVRIGWAGDDPERETMVLTKHHLLGPQALDRVRDAALAIEERAYAYAETQPATKRTDQVPVP